MGTERHGIGVVGTRWREGYTYCFDIVFICLQAKAVMSWTGAILGDLACMYESRKRKIKKRPDIEIVLLRE